MNLKPLGRIIQAIFLATVYLGEKMSTIVCSSSAMLRKQNQQMYGVPEHMSAETLNICTFFFAPCIASR